jgi:hypothetical protein
MANGRLDISTLVDWDGHQNYLLPEVARQWIALRNAYFILTGYWLYTSECYRPVGEEGDYANGRINTQWYWFEYYGRNTKWAAYPGSSSSHGEAMAMDLTGWANRAVLVALAQQYGFTFPFDWEDWHLQYVGNPTIIAPLDTTPLGGFFMALPDAEQTELLSKVRWLFDALHIEGAPYNQVDVIVSNVQPVHDALIEPTKETKPFRPIDILVSHAKATLTSLGDLRKNLGK